MAIYLSGDIHGLIDIDGLTEYFDEDACGDGLTKEDYLIILGDAGILWDGGTRDCEVQRILNELPVTTLWIDGNHENFDLLEAYPEEDRFGGKVHVISDSVIHLMRGQVFKIDGKSFFTFGGGYSIDKYRRTPGVSWWEQEMPSCREYDEGIANLEAVGNRVDYILTHTCPRKVAEVVCYDLMEGEEELQDYLQRIADRAAFDGWFFGHWHTDETFERYRCLYREIVELS